MFTRSAVRIRRQEAMDLHHWLRAAYLTFMHETDGIHYVHVYVHVQQYALRRGF